MIGAALTRLGAEPLLTGHGRFVADVPPTAIIPNRVPVPEGSARG
jgi:hypothetical protein